MTIGDRIRERRESLGLTQEELALKLGYKSRSSVNKIENSRELPLKKVNMMAKALECTPTYLMGWEKESHEEITEEEYKSTENNRLLDVYSNFGYDAYKLLYIYINMPIKSARTLSNHFNLLKEKFSINVPSEEEVSNEWNHSHGIYTEEEIRENTKLDEKLFAAYEELLDAAHSNNNSIPEQIEHDNDIMDDDSEWK